MGEKFQKYWVIMTDTMVNISFELKFSSPEN